MEVCVTGGKLTNVKRYGSTFHWRKVDECQKIWNYVSLEESWRVSKDIEYVSLEESLQMSKEMEVCFTGEKLMGVKRYGSMCHWSKVDECQKIWKYVSLEGN